ncbi:MAG: 4Fe-4S dicluster domain-containing protein [Proteobacteria bacterium]|nr:4Fe-4S dicluster domain-containing protein [Pseudomonadota bacterium]
MQATYDITLKIKRYDPDTRKRWNQDYTLKAGRILRFTDLFRKINNESDPTLAWNSSCEHAQCGTCAVKINGKPMLACELLVENAVHHFGTSVFQVEPITVAPVVRDLVVDLEKAYEKVHKAKPYIIEPKEKQDQENEYPISPREIEYYVDATRCINCFCCAAACMSSPKSFLGPNAVMASIIRLMDPRENAKEERLKLLYSEEGVYRCHTSKACSFVCPKEIDVAHFIALAKEGRFKSS